VQTLQENFAAHRILSSLDSPTWPAAALSSEDAGDWKQRALALSLALLRDGHFEWEDFRQALLRQLSKVEIASREGLNASWRYCQQWALALESVIGAAGLVDAGTLAELQGLAQRAEREAVRLHAA